MCYYILRVWGGWWVGGEAAYSYLAAMSIYYYSCSLVAAADATISTFLPDLRVCMPPLRPAAELSTPVTSALVPRSHSTRC